jgi:carbon monoxide dehydrogenase subunit G
MEYTAREDVEAPIEYVFEQVTDFVAFERSIMRRGGDVERIEGGDEPKVGTKWRVSFRLRGKDRAVNAKVVRVDSPNVLTIKAKSRSADGKIKVELIALSRAHTRLIVTGSSEAKTIPAKMFFQSMRLARGKTEAKFKDFVSDFAKDVQAKYLG